MEQVLTCASLEASDFCGEVASDNASLDHLFSDFPGRREVTSSSLTPVAAGMPRRTDMADRIERLLQESLRIAPLHQFEALLIRQAKPGDSVVFHSPAAAGLRVEELELPQLAEGALLAELSSSVPFQVSLQYFPGRPDGSREHALSILLRPKIHSSDGSDSHLLQEDWERFCDVVAPGGVGQADWEESGSFSHAHSEFPPHAVSFFRPSSGGTPILRLHFPSLGPSSSPVERLPQILPKLWSLLGPFQRILTLTGLLSRPSDLEREADLLSEVSGWRRLPEARPDKPALEFRSLGLDEMTLGFPTQGESGRSWSLRILCPVNVSRRSWRFRFEFSPIPLPQKAFYELVLHGSYPSPSDPGVWTVKRARFSAAVTVVFDAIYSALPSIPAIAEFLTDSWSRDLEHRRRTWIRLFGTLQIPSQRQFASLLWLAPAHNRIRIKSPSSRTGSHVDLRLNRTEGLDQEDRNTMLPGPPPAAGSDGAPARRDHQLKPVSPEDIAVYLERWMARQTSRFVEQVIRELCFPSEEASAPRIQIAQVWDIRREADERSGTSALVLVPRLQDPHAPPVSSAIPEYFRRRIQSTSTTKHTLATFLWVISAVSVPLQRHWESACAAELQQTSANGITWSLVWDSPLQHTLPAPRDIGASILSLVELRGGRKQSGYPVFFPICFRADSMKLQLWSVDTSRRPNSNNNVSFLHSLSFLLLSLSLTRTHAGLVLSLGVLLSVCFFFSHITQMPRYQVLPGTDLWRASPEAPILFGDALTAFFSQPQTEVVDALRRALQRVRLQYRR